MATSNAETRKDKFVLDDDDAVGLVFYPAPADGSVPTGALPADPAVINPPQHRGRGKMATPPKEK